MAHSRARVAMAIWQGWIVVFLDLEKGNPVSCVFAKLEVFIT